MEEPIAIAIIFFLVNYIGPILFIFIYSKIKEKQLERKKNSS